MATLSPTTLREAGLESTLLQLAGLRAAEEESAESGEDIDSMDLDSLVAEVDLVLPPELVAPPH